MPFTDLWGSDGPAFGKNNSWACSQTNQPASCHYEDDIFTNFTLAQIAAHDPSTPLFLYWAAHNVHEPLECPEAQLDKFQFVYDTCAAAMGDVATGKNNSCATQVRHPELDAIDGKTIKQCCFRQYYSAMTNLVDQHIGVVLGALRAKGMYDNALITLASDNGGPICVYAPTHATVRPALRVVKNLATPFTPSPRWPPFSKQTATAPRVRTTGLSEAGKSPTLREACV